MEVIIFCGQSNMQGATEGCPENNAVIENALEYKWLNDSVVPLRHPVGEKFGNPMLFGSPLNDGGSIVPSFCKAYINETGKKVFAIHVACGSTTVGEWQPGTQRYFYAIKKMKAGIAKANQLEKVSKILFVWLQGESDAVIDTTEEEYKKRLTALKDALKKEIGIEKFGIIRVGYFCYLSKWYLENINNREYGKKCDERIMSAQDQIVTEDEDFVMLTKICKDVSIDDKYMNLAVGGHYNNLGVDLIGSTAGKALAKLS